MTASSLQATSSTSGPSIHANIGNHMPLPRAPAPTPASPREKLLATLRTWNRSPDEFLRQLPTVDAQHAEVAMFLYDILTQRFAYPEDKAISFVTSNRISGWGLRRLTEEDWCALLGPRMGLLVYLDLLEVSEKQALKYELVQKIKSINWFLVWMLTSFVLFFIAMAYYFAGLPEKEKERRWAIWVAAACVVSFLGSMVCT